MLRILPVLSLLLAYVDLAIAAKGKEAVTANCKMENGKVTVEIFSKKPIFDVQLKNSDQVCDPQEFTQSSIRFIIPHFQLGICGFTRSESSTDGLDGTFWNNLVWKEKPSSTTTKTTKVKCVQKLSTMLKTEAPPTMPVSVIHIIRLPFGGFPGGMQAAPEPPMPMPMPMDVSAPGLPPGFMSSPFAPPPVPGVPNAGGSPLVWLRSSGFSNPTLH